MTELVREHVRLREVAGRTEALREFTVEPEVDVHQLIVRAVERSALPFGGATTTARHVGEEHEWCAPVGTAVRHARQCLGPEVLDVRGRTTNELLGLGLTRVARAGGRSRGLRAAAALRLR